MLYLPPALDDERTTLTSYLRVQLDAIRDALYGLGEDEVRARPLRSALSLGGLLRHATWIMSSTLVAAGRDGDPEVDHADFAGNFALPEGETVDAAIARYEALKARYLDLVSGLDLDATTLVGPMPWFGVDEKGEASMRYLVVHHVEEFARHAGHADIVREEIDGATAAELGAAVDGRPANEFVTPWRPGTARDAGA